MLKISLRYYSALINEFDSQQSHLVVQNIMATGFIITLHMSLLIKQNNRGNSSFYAFEHALSEQNKHTYTNKKARHIF